MMGSMVESLKGNQRTVTDSGASADCDPLSVTGSFCAGEILCFACRTVCGRCHIGYGTLSFEKSYELMLSNSGAQVTSEGTTA